MPRKEKLAIMETVFERAVSQMKSLGVYRPEYDSTIQIYAELCEQYTILTERFERSKYRIQTSSAQGGMKKAPIVATLEALRKDILAYTDRLCLNPKAFDALNMKPPKKQSTLDRAMDVLRSGSHQDG